MLEMTCQVANTFKKYGIVKGDRIAIYMPMSPLLAATMLACARIGAIHSVVFAGFSSEALKNRILDGMVWNYCIVENFGGVLIWRIGNIGI